MGLITHKVKQYDNKSGTLYHYVDDFTHAWMGPRPRALRVSLALRLGHLAGNRGGAHLGRVLGNRARYPALRPCAS